MPPKRVCYFKALQGEEKGIMQIQKLKPKFDSLQRKFGDKKLDPIYGAGYLNKPDFCFVFMNPTGRNISSSKEWKGLKAPWLGTKNIWKLFSSLDFLDKEMYQIIQSIKSSDWNEDFSQKIYSNIKNNKIYITNLSKSTQKDARSLPNSIFKQYLPLFFEEIKIIKPKIIISFGNQVSSILLNRPIKVSEYRTKYLSLNIENSIYPVYPIYYPVGQGMRNIDKAIEDIEWIKNQTS